jgi:hypothetical protein
MSQAISVLFATSVRVLAAAQAPPVGVVTPSPARPVIGYAHGVIALHCGGRVCVLSTSGRSDEGKLSRKSQNDDEKEDGVAFAFHSLSPF